MINRLIGAVACVIIAVMYLAVIAIWLRPNG